MSYGLMLVALLPESLLREAHSMAGEVRRILRERDDELVAGRLEPFRREQQARRVVELLQQAEASRGRGRPVLAAGRDGVTVCEQPHGFFEVATCATLFASPVSNLQRHRKQT